jgi:hypothetical protein
MRGRVPVKLRYFAELPLSDVGQLLKLPARTQMFTRAAAL